MLAELRSLLLPAAPGLALVSKGQVPATGESTAICSRRAGAEGRPFRFRWKSAHLFLGGSEADGQLQPKGTKLASPDGDRFPILAEPASCSSATLRRSLVGPCLGKLKSAP